MCVLFVAVSLVDGLNGVGDDPELDLVMLIGLDILQHETLSQFRLHVPLLHDLLIQLRKVRGELLAIRVLLPDVRVQSLVARVSPCFLAADAVVWTGALVASPVLLFHKLNIGN
jgi:hypothetical protein